MAMVEILPSGCWRWRGRLDPHGHGQFRLGRVVPAARAAWFLVRGEELSRNYRLASTCGTEACVLPEHREVVPCRKVEE